MSVTSTSEFVATGGGGGGRSELIRRTMGGMLDGPRGGKPDARRLRGSPRGVGSSRSDSALISEGVEVVSGAPLGAPFFAGRAESSLVDASLRRSSFFGADDSVVLVSTRGFGAFGGDGTLRGGSPIGGFFFSFDEGGSFGGPRGESGLLDDFGRGGGWRTAGMRVVESTRVGGSSPSSAME